MAPADDAFNRCALPADVRSFIDDSELCEHFRSEPWPEGNSDVDHARRSELVEGVRTTCAGLSARRRALSLLHHDDAASSKALAAIDLDDAAPQAVTTCDPLARHALHGFIGGGIVNE